MIDFSKINLDKGFKTAFIVVSIVIPPFWFFYDFVHLFFLNSDLIKLLLICLALGSSTALLFSFLWLMAMESAFEHSIDLSAYNMLSIIAMSSALNYLIYFLPSGLIYVFDLDATLKNGTRVAIGSAVFCAWFLGSWSRQRRRFGKSKTSDDAKS